MKVNKNINSMKDFYSQELLDANNEYMYVFDENFNIIAISRKDYPDFDYDEYLKALDDILGCE